MSSKLQRLAFLLPLNKLYLGALLFNLFIFTYSSQLLADSRITASFNENKYHSYLELGGVKYFNQNSTAAGSYDLFLPLLQNNNQLLFADLRIFDRSGNSFEGNAHIGFRKLYLDKKQLFGIYAAYDYKRSEHRNGFNQIMLGAEYWHDRWFIGGNIYKPLGWHKRVFKEELQKDKLTSRAISNTKYYEKALGGVDAEVGYTFTNNLTGYAGGYYFHASDTGTTAGPKVRVTYDYRKPQGRILGIFDGVSMEIGGQHDKPRGNTAYIGIKLKVGLTNLEKNSNLFGFERHMIDPVRRDPDVVIGQDNIKQKFYQSGPNGFQEGDNGYGDGLEIDGRTLEELLQEFGLPANATLQEIKKKHRKYAKLYHPDRNKNGASIFIYYQNIYETILNRFSSKNNSHNAQFQFQTEAEPELQIHIFDYIPNNRSDDNDNEDKSNPDKPNSKMVDWYQRAKTTISNTVKMGFISGGGVSLGESDFFIRGRPLDDNLVADYIEPRLLRGYSQSINRVVTKTSTRNQANTVSVAKQNLTALSFNPVVDPNKNRTILSSIETRTTPPALRSPERRDSYLAGIINRTENADEVNLSYEYEDQDINTLLQLRVQEEGLDLNRIVLMPPLQDSGDQLEIQLREESSRYFSRILNEEVLRRPRNILVPLNLNRVCHWAGIVIRINGFNQVVRVQYVDSLGLRISEEVREVLCRVYGRNIVVENAQGLIQPQSDCTGCGPLAVENLIRILKDNTDKEKVTKKQMRAIRAHHVEIAEKYEPQLNFNQRQRGNIRSFEYTTKEGSKEQLQFPVDSLISAYMEIVRSNLVQLSSKLADVSQPILTPVMYGGGEDAVSSIEKPKISTSNSYLEDKFPPNLNYDYGSDDILLIMDRYIRKKGLTFQAINDKNKNYKSIFATNEKLTVEENKLPTYIVDSNGLKLSFENYTIVIAGDLQSTMHLEENALDKFLNSVSSGKYVVVFPLHIGGTPEAQGGHWNLATLQLAFDTKKAEFKNHEPLGSKVETIENDTSITSLPIYTNLKDKLKGFSLNQTTDKTDQQNDAHLCGAIAAENFQLFLGESKVLEKKYRDHNARKELRKKHIEEINSEAFARQQNDNYIFTGFKNDEYQKASGPKITSAIQAYILSDPESEIAIDFMGLMQDIRQQHSDTDVRPILEPSRKFFRKYQETFEKIDVEGTSLFAKFFTLADGELKTCSDYSVIDLLSCLAKSFCHPSGQKDTSVENSQHKSSGYKRAQGYSNTYRGDEYQKLVGMKYAWDAYNNHGTFKLSTERVKDKEGDWDFGKFDDLILETDKYIEVVQVKHAGCVDEKKQIYTVEMLAGTAAGSTEVDRRKKAALHIYYDSWYKLKEHAKNKKKEIRFVFYTNHDLDNSLKPFYDKAGGRLTGLLKEHTGETQKNQKKIIDSIYRGSTHIRKKVAKRLVQDGSLNFSIDEEIKKEDWQRLIDESLDKIIRLLVGSNSTFRNRGKPLIDKEDFKKLNYLLIGCFGYNPTEKASQNITLPKDFFTADLSSRPIHEYFRKRLLDRARELAVKNKLTEMAGSKSLKINKDLVVLSKVTSLLSDIKASFSGQDKVDFSINKDKDGNLSWWFSLIFGIDSSDIPYDKNRYNLDKFLVGFLAQDDKLPILEFTNVAGLDALIRAFIQDYNFSIKQPTIEELEKEISESINDHFNIESIGYYNRFQDLFLREFRSPNGREITPKEIKRAFDDAKIKTLREHLVGYAERYLKKIIKGKSDIVDPGQLKELDKKYSKIDMPVLMVKGEQYAGKSFTVATWIKNNLIGRKIIKENSYAFVPAPELWESDLEIFEKELQLFVIDDVDEIENSLIQQLITIARRHDKKLILICNEESSDKIGALLSGGPYTTVVIKLLNDEQVIRLSDRRIDDYLIYGNVYVEIKTLLLSEYNYGLGRIIRNSGYLIGLKEYFVTKKPVSTPHTNDIYIPPTATINSTIDFRKLLRRLQDRLAIYDKDLDFNITKSFSDKERFNIISDKDLRQIDLDKIKDGETQIIDFRGLEKLTQDLRERLLSIKRFVVVTNSFGIIKDLLSEIKEACWAPEAKTGQSRIIQTQIPVTDWIEEKPENWMDAILQRYPMGKKIIVSSDAGMGKTTTVKKLAAIQTVREIHPGDYSWAIPIYLDQVDEKDNERTLGEFILNTLEKQYEDQHLEITAWLKSAILHDLEQGNLLLLLDGGDQVKESHLSNCAEIYDKLLAYPHVVLFTRPNQSLLRFTANYVLTLETFSDKQIKSYFRKAFSKPKANTFYDPALRFMREYDQLREMFGVPLQCYLLWQAWLPDYEEWERTGISQNYKPTDLVSLYKQFIESIFIIHFKRNLKMQDVSSLVQERKRANALGLFYLNHLARVAIEQEFSDLSEKLTNKLSTEVISEEWLNKDQKQIALINSYSDDDSAVTYRFAHNTYQEYFAAKFFVEGMFEISLVDPNQVVWCKELLTVARFIKRYEKFWRFVFAWLEFHTKESTFRTLTYKDELKKLEDLFKQYEDYVDKLHIWYWRGLAENTWISKPKSYLPKSNLMFIDDVEESEELATDRSSNDRMVDNSNSNLGKEFEDFKLVEQYIKAYKGRTECRYDSDICLAIRDLKTHPEIDLTKRYNLIKHAKRPNNTPHKSFRVHEAIADTLAKLWTPNDKLDKEIVKELVKELVDYLDPKQKNYDFIDVYGSRVVRDAAFNALKKVSITKNNYQEFHELLNYLLTPNAIFDSDRLLYTIKIISTLKTQFNRRLDLFVPVKKWLGIKDKYVPPNNNDLDLHKKRLKKLISGDRLCQWNEYKYIDSGIPVVCSMKDDFNCVLAAFLIQIISREDYWQFPRALSEYIPFLLTHHSEDNIYPFLALKVYLRHLKQIVAISTDEWTDARDEYNFLAFCEHQINAMQAMKYAWKYYNKYRYKEAAKIIWLWGNRLAWPLFKTSSKVGLTMVVPLAGHIESFETDSEELINDAVLIFKKQLAKKEGEKFLELVTQKYIDTLNFSDPNFPGLPGGDIELNELANIYDVTINTYHKGDSQIKILSTNGDGNTEVDLFLDNHHYQVYNPDTGEMKDVPKDINSLFHGFIRSAKKTETSSLEEVSKIRKKVVKNLQSIFDKQGSKYKNKPSWELTSIGRSFGEIVHAKNETALQEALLKLPPSWLRVQAEQLARKILDLLLQQPTLRGGGKAIIKNKITNAAKSQNSSALKIRTEPNKEIKSSQSTKTAADPEETFLNNVSESYIEGIRNAYPDKGEVLWGGDIELIEIGQLYDLNIIVHYQENGNLKSHPPIGPPEGKKIHLFLDHGHYQICDQNAQNRIDVPSDGNCLFHAILRVKNNSSSSTLEEVSELRNDVARSLHSSISILEGSTRTNNQQNPIYTRFAAILNAENESQLRNAVMDLPPGSLRNEAEELVRNRLNIKNTSFSQLQSTWPPFMCGGGKKSKEGKGNEEGDAGEEDEANANANANAANLTIPRAYKQWLSRFKRINYAYKQGWISDRDLLKYQLFLLEMGQYNANFELAELDRLDYPRSPFAIMCSHHYLRWLDTWAMEILRFKFRDKSEHPDLFPIWIDSELFWKELNRYCVSKSLNNSELVTTIKDFIGRGYLDLDEEIWFKLELEDLINLKRLVKKESLMKLSIAEILIPLFQSLDDKTEEAAFQLEVRNDILAALHNMFPKIETSLNADKVKLASFLKKPHRLTLDFVQICQLATRYNITFPTKNGEDLESYLARNKPGFKKFLEEIDSNIVVSNSLYKESIKNWLLENKDKTELLIDTFFSQVICYSGVQFNGLNAIVFLDTERPPIINVVLGNLGYRLDPILAIRTILDRKYYSLLFFDHNETEKFWEELTGTIMVSSLDKKESEVIKKLGEYVVDLTNISYSLEKRYDVSFDYELSHLGEKLEFLDNINDGFELYAKFLFEYLVEFLLRYKDNKAIKLVTYSEIKQALTGFLEAWDSKNMSDAVKNVQLVVDVMLLDIEHAPLAEKDLEATIKESMHEKVKKHVQKVLFTPYAMRAFVRVFQILDDLYLDRAPNIFVTNQNYFEWLSNLDRLRRERFAVLPVRHLSEIDKTADIIFAEIHPNNVVELRQFAHDVDQLLSRMSKWSVKPRTLVLDVTLNDLGDDEIQKLLREASPLIKEGHLNLILIQSLTKFSQLGLDRRSGGVIAVINNGNAWSDVNKKLSEFSQIEPVDKSTINFFSYFADLNRLVENYIRLVNRNVRFVYRRIMEQFDQLEIFHHDRFQITMSSDPRSCYVALNMNGLLPGVDQDFILGTSDIETFAKDLLQLLIHPLCEFLGLSLTERMSIGFPLSSVNPVFDAMRFTIGLEEDKELELYAEVLSYVSFVLNRQENAQLFFDFSETDRLGSVYTLRYDYFREKVEQFKAMTPGSRYSYRFEFEGTGYENSYRPSLDQESRQLKRKVVLENGSVILSREVPCPHYVNNGRGTHYIDECTPETIYVPDWDGEKVVEKPLSDFDMQQRRICIACLTEYAPDGKQNDQNVNLVFVNRLLPNVKPSSVTLANMQILGDWNSKLVYGPFVWQRYHIFFYLYQKRIKLLFNGKSYTEKNIVIDQGGMRTPLLDLPLDEREFFFRQGAYEKDRNARDFYQLYPRFSQPGINMQYIPYIPDLITTIQFYIEDGKLIVERDFKSCSESGVTVYKRFLGEKLTCFEVDFWGEKDPVLARFMRLMAAVYVQNKVKSVGFLARDKRFFWFLFNLNYDGGVDELFEEAVERVIRDKNRLQHLLANYSVDNSTYNFIPRGLSLSWPSGCLGVDYISNKVLIDQALELLKKQNVSHRC